MRENVEMATDCPGQAREAFLEAYSNFRLHSVCLEHLETSTREALDQALADLPATGHNYNVKVRCTDRPNPQDATACVAPYHAAAEAVASALANVDLPSGELEKLIGGCAYADRPNPPREAEATTCALEATDRYRTAVQTASAALSDAEVPEDLHRSFVRKCTEWPYPSEAEAIACVHDLTAEYAAVQDVVADTELPAALDALADTDWRASLRNAVTLWCTDKSFHGQEATACARTFARRLATALTATANTDVPEDLRRYIVHGCSTDQHNARGAVTACTRAATAAALTDIDLPADQRKRAISDCAIASPLRPDQASPQEAVACVLATAEGNPPPPPSGWLQ